MADNHFRALGKCPSAKVTAIASRTKAHAVARAKEWGIRVAESPEDLVASDDVDVVFVLTNTETHYEYATMAMQNGKHVLVEKPVSYDEKEICGLQETATKESVLCVPGHSYLYLPEIARMQRNAKAGFPGEPFYFYMSETYRMPDDYVGKYHGPVREVLCHEFYVMLALLGVPDQISAFGSTFRGALADSWEQVVVNARFSGGALAQVFLSWVGVDQTSDPWTFKLKVLGRTGGEHFSRRDVVLHDRLGTGISSPLYDEMFECQDRYFIEQCVLSDEKPLSSLTDAFRALRLMLATEESIRTGACVHTREIHRP